MTFLLMNCGVAGSANREQVFQRIVTQLFGRCHATAINVMNVQIIPCAAALAGMVVALKSQLAVAAEHVNVLRLYAVVAYLVEIAKCPISRSLCAFYLLAVRTVDLWAGRVNKIFSAASAKQNRPNGHGPFRFSVPTQTLGVVFSPVFRRTRSAYFLSGCSGLVGHSAHNTSPFTPAMPSLPVSLERTGLAPLEIWRSFINRCAAIWAGKHSVFTHDFSRKLKCSHYNVIRRMIHG